MFRNSAKAAGLFEHEIAEIVDAIALDPEAGDLMKGTGGARKIRIAGKGRGKSGGYRVITYFAGQDMPVFLLDVYGKRQKVNLTAAERNQLQAILARIVLAHGTRALIRR